jgi:hypothetical protein
MRYVEATVAALIGNTARRATKFIAPNYVVSAQRVTWGNRIDKRDKRIQIALKIGTPNYHERQFIKDCVKAGEPFPVKKIKLMFFRPRKPKHKKKKQ